jgi:peptide/nickel transport system substrate-binding protein
MKLRTTSVAAFLAIVLAACTSGESDGGSSPATQSPQAGGDATVLIHEPTAQDLNKLTTFVQGTFWVTGQIFDTLTFIDQEGETVPLLAESWEVSPDNLVWTFNIREGVTFSDGSTLDANDVAFSIEDGRRPENPIGILLAAVDSVSAPSNNTVEIGLKYPYPALPEALAGCNFAIIPEDWGGVEEEAFYEAPVGSGPFMLDPDGQWLKGSSIDLVRNPNYWQEGKPYLDSVTIKTVTEQQRILQLRGGQADLIFGPDVTQSALDLQSTPGFTVADVPTYRTMFIALNQAFEPFTDPHVRRAMAFALDRDALKAALFGFPILSGSYLPTELSVHDPDVGFPFDVEAAGEELAQSKFPDGFSVSVLVDAGSQQENQLAQVLQQQLREINIELRIEQLDLGARIDAWINGDYEMAFQDINQVTADPAEMTAWAIDPSFGAFFFTGYDDPALAALARKAARTSDPEERQDLFSQVQEGVAEAGYIIIPYGLPDIWSSTDALQGVVFGLADTIDLSGAFIAEE